MAIFVFTAVLLFVFTANLTKLCLLQHNLLPQKYPPDSSLLLPQFLADSIVAAADAIGQVIAGDLGFGGLMKAILIQLANFLKNIGAQLIEFGILIVAFKSTLKSVLANPWAAIGVGVAMVAAAAIMTALINKNAEESVPALASGGLAYGKTLALVGDNANAAVDPEVIAPLSKLQAILPSAKDLSAADGQLDKFDDFEFIADVPDVDASIHLNKSHLRECLKIK